VCLCSQSKWPANKRAKRTTFSPFSYNYFLTGSSVEEVLSLARYLLCHYEKKYKGGGKLFKHNKLGSDYV
jgi:hypothetical protein